MCLRKRKTLWQLPLPQLKNWWENAPPLMTKTKFAIAVTGAKLGVSGDGRINAREKRHRITCVQRVFSMAEKNLSPICTHCADNSRIWNNKWACCKMLATRSKTIQCLHPADAGTAIGRLRATNSRPYIFYKTFSAFCNTPLLLLMSKNGVFSLKVHHKRAYFTSLCSTAKDSPK